MQSISNQNKLYDIKCSETFSLSHEPDEKKLTTLTNQWP